MSINLSWNVWTSTIFYWQSIEVWSPINTLVQLKEYHAKDFCDWRIGDIKVWKQQAHRVIISACLIKTTNCTPWYTTSCHDILTSYLINVLQLNGGPLLVVCSDTYLPPPNLYEGGWATFHLGCLIMAVNRMTDDFWTTWWANPNAVLQFWIATPNINKRVTE